MRAMPVITRELSAEAQRPFNYWLRVIGAGTVVLLIGALLLDGSRRTSEPGALIFTCLHALLFIGIWILVPLLTADCLSREKRDGTLGLLFLTPLTPQKIVAAKAMIHALRAVTMLLAMIPAMLVPFLLGGIGWREAFISLNLNLAAVLMALGAGLLASAWCQSMHRAIALAVILSTVFSALFAFTFAWGFFTQVSDRIFFASSPAGATAIGFLYMTGTGAMWHEVAGRLAPAQQMRWVWLSAEMFGLSLLVLALSVAVCGQRLRRDWRQVPLGLKSLRLVEVFCAPRFATRFMRRHMNRMLDRNPIGWLHEYSWSARAIKWGWLGLFGVADSWIVSEQVTGGSRWRDLLAAQLYMGLALLLGIGATAVGSFRRERQNGVLELLLVSPLSGERLVAGRIFGIWSQFFPATLLLLVIWWQLPGIGGSYRWGNWIPDFKWFIVVGFITVPVVGMWCSLLHRSFMVAWLLACILGVGLPYYISNWIAGMLHHVFPQDLAFFMIATVIQAGVAFVAWRRLQHNLARRTFTLN